MCCIFTCCGWMIDLIQRLWTFTMSCCISSAVCCALVTASMSGIAMGYNYSLAEYIDLKETNVSVYLKRGVFDDEIADDMDWRRSGHMPVEGHLRDSNLMTGAPQNEEMPRSGRRMDDSMVVSDDQHKFEGSLMRLTVKPPSYKASTEPVTSDDQMVEILGKYPKGSLEQVKAIHSLINMRKANTQRNTRMTTSEITYVPDFQGRRMGGIAPGGVPMYSGPNSDFPVHINDARLAVPDSEIGRSDNWFLGKDKIPESYRRTMDIDFYPDNPAKPYTYPKPIIFTNEMKRPTRPKPSFKPTHTTPILREILKDEADPNILNQLSEDEVQMFKSQLLKDKDNLERLRNDRLRKYGNKVFESEDDYAEQANKGAPIRKRRQLNYKRKPKASEKPSTDVNSANDGKNNSSRNVSDTLSANTDLKDCVKKSKNSHPSAANENKIETQSRFNAEALVLNVIINNHKKNTSSSKDVTSTVAISEDSYFNHGIIKKTINNMADMSESILVGKLKPLQNKLLTTPSDEKCRNGTLKSLVSVLVN